MPFTTKAANLASMAFLVTFLIAAATELHAGTDPFIGEIQPTSVDGFCPVDWEPAAGQLVPISPNPVLFSLYGTLYGGDGLTTFALPDLRGRTPVHTGRGTGLSQVSIAQKDGQETTSLRVEQLTKHSHRVNVNNADGDKAGPGGKLLAAAPPNGTGSETIYSTQPANKTMSAEMIEFFGSGDPFSIQDPSVTIRYCVSLKGAFPNR